MVFHTTVVEDIASYLASPFYLLLARLNLCLCLKTFLHGAVIKLRFEQSHGIVAVFELLAALGILNENLLLLACVGINILIAQADTCLHLIDVLTSCSTTPEQVPTDLRWVNEYLDGIVNKRRHKDTGKTRHTLALGIERRNTHQTVYSILAL